MSSNVRVPRARCAPENLVAPARIFFFGGCTAELAQLQLGRGVLFTLGRAGGEEHPAALHREAHGNQHRLGEYLGSHQVHTKGHERLQQGRVCREDAHRQRCVPHQRVPG